MTAFVGEMAEREAPAPQAPPGTHVGLNLIFMVPGETGGMETIVRNLLPELAASAPHLRLTAFVNREAASEPGPWRELGAMVTVPVRSRRREQWVLGEQLLLPAFAARARVDLLHSMGSTAPATGPFRRIVSVMDLIYAHYPDAHSGIRDKGMRMLVPLAVRRSHRAIAISESTRADLLRFLHADPDRVDVTPLGVSPPHAPGDGARARARLELGGRRVLLALSARRPHKNLPALFEAIGLLEAGARPLLVMPGYPTWQDRELHQRARALGLERDVRFAGWLPEAELEDLWAAADAFVFPSLFEGFGLPVLEAMARGVPVACSNASSLPEVAGDAALLFDPRDPHAIAGALSRLLGDDDLRERLRRAGPERARAFTWRRTAELTLASYARALAADGSG